MQTVVDIIVKANTAVIDKVNTKLKGTAGNAVKAGTGLDKTAKSAENLGRKASAAKTNVDRLAGAVRNLLAAAAVINTAKFIIFKTAELETQTRSLQVLTGELSTAKQIIQELQGFAAVTPFTSSELIDTAKRLKAFGVETEDLVDITKRLGDIAGATGADLGGIATAFGQIAAKGRLQGEELLQLQERGVDLQGELQRMYGLTGEEFRKALEKGQISAEATQVAIENLTEAGGKYADGAISQSDTLAGKFSTLIDKIEEVARKIGEVLKPALKDILDIAIDVVTALGEVLSGGIMAAFAAGRLELSTPGGTEGDLESLIQTTQGVTGAGLNKNQIDRLIGSIQKNQQFARDIGARIASTRPFGLTENEIKLFEELQGASNAAIQRLQEARKLVKESKKGGDRDNPLLGGGNGNEDDDPSSNVKIPSFKDVVGSVNNDVVNNRIKERTLYLQEGINQALKDGNTQLAEKLRLDQQLVPIEEKLKALDEFKTAVQSPDTRAQLSELSDEEFQKQLDEQLRLIETKTTGLNLDRQQLLANIEEKRLTNQQALTKAQEDSLRPLQEQQRLLEAKLAGNEEAVRLEIEAENIANRVEGLSKEQVLTQLQKNAALEKEVQLAEQLKAAYTQLATNIAGELTGALGEVIKGTKSVEQAFSDMLTNIGNMFIDMAMQILQSAITKQLVELFSNLGSSGGFGGSVVSGIFGGGFADGGRPEVGKYSLVGEHGPEIVRFDQPATVYSNSDSQRMASAMNRYNSGERGGELLTGAGSDASNGGNGGSPVAAVNPHYSFNTVKFADQDYVDTEQLQLAMAKASADGARMGEARTIGRLKGSPTARRAVGL